MAIRMAMLKLSKMVSLLASILWAVAATSAAHAAGDADNGKLLVNDWCVSCHYVGAEERAVAADQAPPLAMVAQYSDERLQNFLTQPHPPMPNFNLARQQIDDIIAYLHTLAP